MQLKKALAIFIRTPILNTVKTRLKSHLSPQQILNLYQAFLKDIENRFGGNKYFDRWYSVAPENFDAQKLSSFLHPDRWFLQHGDSLGDRMNDAFKALFDQGYAQVVLIGSDVPQITVNIIRSAFIKLDGADVVLGPTYDGGYYLIGLKQPCPDLFHDITWSTARVWSETVDRIQRQNLNRIETEPLNDVDEYDDLLHLKKILRNLEPDTADFPRHTWESLNKIIISDS